jgi:hypothetical protein
MLVISATGRRVVGPYFPVGHPSGTMHTGVIRHGSFSTHSPLADEDLADVDLDECNGHTTDELGYHYHAYPAEENNVLTCFTGATVGGSSADGGGPGGGQGAPPAGGDGGLPPGGADVPDAVVPAEDT